MVKTVLHELVKLRGAAIKGHLSMVPIDMKPQPIILAYIDLNLEVVEFKWSILFLLCYRETLIAFMCLHLQTLAAARMLTSTGPVGQTHWGDSTANNSSSGTQSADAQLKVYPSI